MHRTKVHFVFLAVLGTNMKEAIDCLIIAYFKHMRQCALAVDKLQTSGVKLKKKLLLDVVDY